MPSPQEVNSNLELQISISDIVGVLLKRWKILISVTALFFGFSVFYALSLPEVYRASILLAESSDENQLGSGYLPGGLGGAVAGIAGLSIGRSSVGVERALAVLKSRKFVKNYITNQDLLPILFKSDWDEKKKTWRDNSAPNEWQAYRAFIALLNTSTGADGLVTITVEHTDQRNVAELANSLIRYLNEVMRQEAVDEANKSIAFLESQVEKTNLVNSQNILYSLIEQQTEKIMIASVREGYSFKVIDPAVTPDERISPNRTNIVLLITAMGAFVSCLLVGLLTAFSNRK